MIGPGETAYRFRPRFAVELCNGGRYVADNMSEIESLRARVDEVERILGLLVKGQTTVHTVQDGALLRQNARLTAMTSLVRELCLRFGLSDEEFAGHLDVRTSYFHDSLLQVIRAKNPNLAGRLDNRDADEISTTKQFPPLFPEDLAQGE
jgi:hypothetical protein